MTERNQLILLAVKKTPVRNGSSAGGDSKLFHNLKPNQNYEESTY